MFVLAVLALLAHLAPASVSAAERRVALVIGNGAYAQSPLPNTINDARAMTETLQNLGFKVITLLNATQKEMYRAIYDFSAELEQGGVGLFYYAGHAVQIRGRNFMIPVGSRIRVEDHVEPESVDLGRVLGRMGGARNQLNIVILDACRDNPFGESFRYQVEGLAQTRAPANSFIAYAAAPGELAADGAGTNSYYTGALVKAMAEPGLTIEQAFKSVSAEVRKATRNLQIPWTSSSITQDFFFNPASKTASEKEPNGSGKAVDREVVFWQSIYNTMRPQYFEAYLAQFPDGIFASLAKEKLAELRAIEQKSTPPGDRKPQAAKPVETAAAAADTGAGLQTAIDEAMAEARSQGADYIEQVEAASTVLKDRLRRSEEMRLLAEAAQQQVIKAATEKAEKQYNDRLAKAQRDAEAAAQRIVTDGEKAAEAEQEDKIEEAEKQAAEALQQALVDARQNADKQYQSSIAAAEKQAEESRRKELAAANDRVAEEYRRTIARANADAEKMRQRMMAIAKKKADRELQQKLSDARRAAEQNERAVLTKLKKQATDKRSENLKLAEKQHKADADKQLESAETKADEEYEAAVALAREKAKQERARILAEAKAAAEAERKTQLARLSPKSPDAPVADRKPDKGTPAKSSAGKTKPKSVASVPSKQKKPSPKESTPSMAELGLGKDVSPDLKRAIESAMYEARQRGQGRQGQVLAALQAIKKHRAGEPKAASAPPSSGKSKASAAMTLGLANANPEFREIIEVTMQRARAEGKSFDEQVRTALKAVKLYRESERKNNEGLGTDSAQISQLLLGDSTADPALRRAIVFAVARARSKGEDFTGQMRAALAAIKAHRAKK